MGANVLPLVIPLLAAGFLFVTIFYPTRYLAASAEGQRLFFLCAATGIAITAIGFPVYRVVAPTAVEDWAARQYGAAIVAPLLFTLAAAVGIALALNLILCCTHCIVGTQTLSGRREPTWTWVYGWMAKRSGDPLQRMLIEAAASLGPEAERQDRLVLLSLASRKVYCGFVIEVAPMHRTAERYVRIIPLFSDTRDKDSLQFIHRLDYPVVHYWRIKRRLHYVEQQLTELAARRSLGVAMMAKLETERLSLSKTLDEFANADAAAREYLESFVIDDWIKVIPLAEIESASFHDEDAYTQWFAGRARHAGATRDA